MEHKWEVAIAKGTAARVVVARDLGPWDLAPSIQQVLHQGYAVLITRSDWTVEARREKWESEFYDVDRAGRRRRRYRKTDIERQWEKFFTDQRGDARRDRGNRKQGHIECPECGWKWSRRTPAEYVHVCGRGLVVREDEGDD